MYDKAKDLRALDLSNAALLVCVPIETCPGYLDQKGKPVLPPAE